MQKIEKSPAVRTNHPENELLYFYEQLNDEGKRVAICVIKGLAKTYHKVKFYIVK